MKVFQVLKGLINHPLNRESRVIPVIRFLRWQMLSRIIGYPIIWPWIGRAKLVVERGMTGATGNLYNGLHEFPEMGFLLHFVRRNDLVVDVGANIGAYTILASVVGDAQVVALEPVPTTFQHLSRNVLINGVSHQVRLIQAAAGSIAGFTFVSTSEDAANHVQDKANFNNISVNLVTLDDILLSPPILLKIDVEGFETEVIRGAQKILANPQLKAIIIELNGLGSRYGYTDAGIHAELVSYGFKPHLYDPFTRSLRSLSRWGNHNTLYLRDVEFVSDRVSSAQAFEVHSQLI